MAAVIETCKPTNPPPASKVQRPKRDFLREHREYLRNIQNQKAAKSKDTKNSFVGRISKEVNGNMLLGNKQTAGNLNITLKSKDLMHLARKADRTSTRQPIEKQPGTFISKGVEQRKRAGVIHSNSLTSDQFAQTCDIEGETFLEGARLLSPSEFVLEAIRIKSQPPPEPKPKPIKRKIDRHTCVLNAHLSNLKEFLEKGSVSRRKKSEIQRNSNIQKFLVRGRMNVRGGTTRPNFFEAETSSEGCKLATIPKRESIGDGPKHSEDRKLIVVYQKD
ncbi:unnamed protein product [Hermetia illucens]|uniref:Uncharacterized protein n=1 Tax=Hermetia illucens TaxID=343691 RepID=A0A7R8UVD7_HERIL|nr:unnamed protein product [Hermetia illucens]